MTDTPRTDSSELPHALDDHHFVVGSFFARQLERELNAANESFRKLNIHTLNLVDRIRRLEEAGNELIWAFCPASVSMMTERESDALKLWNKAKEAKP